MNPFDKVTFKRTINDIEFTYGGTVIATYTNDDNEEMCIVSFGDETLHVKSSDLTAI